MVWEAWRTQEWRDCGLFLRGLKRAVGSIWQGGLCLCKKAPRGHWVKLWRPSLGFSGNPKMSGARAMGHLPRRAAHRELRQPKRDESCRQKAGRYLSPLTPDVSYRTCVCTGGFWFCSGLVFPDCALSPPFWSSDLYSVLLNIGRLWYAFWFLQGVTIKRLPGRDF